MLQVSHSNLVASTEHPLDVIKASLSMMADEQRCALVFVTDILGGAVRAKGAVMAVCEDGSHAGYLSGGCIDEDVKLQAIEAIKSASFKKLTYGEGSPFYDLKLPCGGAIEVSICPNLSLDMLGTIVQKLDNRLPVSVQLSTLGEVLVSNDKIDTSPTATGWKNEYFYVQYYPKLKLRIAGRGTDPIALAQIASSAGLPVSLWSPDEDTINALSNAELETCVHLKTPTQLPENVDDNWTAFVLMFHDSQWEAELLKDALSGRAFYIGAVGSKRTHARRKTNLENLKVPRVDIDRIHAPIGLVPSLRDASMLAISSLAEIIEEFQNIQTQQ